jgi:hypothetical protein
MRAVRRFSSAGRRAALYCQEEQMHAPPAILHRERQRFTQPWLWLLVLGVTVIIWGGGFQQLVLGTPFGNNPAPDIVLLIMLILFGIGFPLLVLRARLDSEVTTDGIRIRFFPFHIRFREWTFDDIDSVEARTYSPISEFGGWGIRLGCRCMAYNVKGDQGIQLVLRTGRRILIGTQDPDSFMDAVDQAWSADHPA